MKIVTFASFSFATVLLLGTTPGFAQTPPTTPSTGASAAASRPAPRPAGSPDTSADYKLVPGDKLRIEVYKDPTLTQSLQIRPDGKITLPYVGDIAASGLTPTGLRDSIAQALKEYIASPNVTVIVVETQPQTVSVMGEVNSPGTQQLRHRMTILDALAAAGGFSDFANTKSIVIKRQAKTGVQTLRFNYKDAIKGDQPPFYLQPGDIVIVP